jgi:ABC-type Mn2+/Zn2+ transport system ATPase subunit
MKTPILQMTGISAAYDNKTVLENINLTVFERDFLGVIGPNGGGKTTLIKVMLGLLNPTAGKVTFYQEGKEVPEISMGYLPQYNSIDKKFPISVYEVVLSGLNRQKSLFRSFSPARVVKYRFEKDQIEQLQKIEWWNFEETKLREIERFFFDLNIFIESTQNDSHHYHH